MYAYVASEREPKLTNFLVQANGSVTGVAKNQNTRTFWMAASVRRRCQQSFHNPETMTSS